MVRLYSSLPRTALAQVLGRQLLKAGTSVGAHCRVANRAKSSADFISRIEGALQELDEIAYWLDPIAQSGSWGHERVTVLMKDARALTAMLVTIANKVKSRK